MLTSPTLVTRSRPRSGRARAPPRVPGRSGGCRGPRAPCGPSSLAPSTSPAWRPSAETLPVVSQPSPAFPRTPSVPKMRCATRGSLRAPIVPSAEPERKRARRNPKAIGGCAARETSCSNRVPGSGGRSRAHVARVRRATAPSLPAGRRACRRSRASQRACVRWWRERWRGTAGAGTQRLRSLAAEQPADLVAVERLVEQQGLRDALDLGALVADDRERPLVGLGQEALDLLIDLARGGFAVVAAAALAAARGTRSPGARRS